tara:strand:- start:205 stop:1329 length:1125 start_codon:yes stop_codon:yes gene_type:complete
MPVTYEPLDVNTDTTTTKTILHEVIPLTGTIISGTYNDENIKNFTHGMFQSVYDYPFLSSSANHIFDLTTAFDESSPLSGAVPHTQQAKRINIYNQFSQILLGYKDGTSTVEIFESDLDVTEDTAGRLMKEVFIVPFSRLTTKDQIKKGTFSMKLGTGSFLNPFSNNNADSILMLQDLSASDQGGTSPHVGGDYGLLFASSGSMTIDNGTANGAASDKAVGVLFYQAGIAVISSSVFNKSMVPNDDFLVAVGGTAALSQSFSQALTGSSISASCDGLRNRIADISFNNSTEINSTIYFCRMPVNKFNYSSNPTYVDSTTGQIKVKNVASDLPIAYVASIGLYNTRNELLAVAKLSEPLKKTPQNELTIRVRLDY